MTASQEFRDKCSKLRSAIRELEEEVRTLKNHPGRTEAVDAGEVAAHLTIAYRHLEDARMRLGKAIQYHEGRESCFDKPPLSGKIPPPVE